MPTPSEKTERMGCGDNIVLVIILPAQVENGDIFTINNGAASGMTTSHTIVYANTEKQVPMTILLLKKKKIFF